MSDVWRTYVVCHLWSIFEDLVHLLRQKCAVVVGNRENSTDLHRTVIERSKITTPVIFHIIQLLTIIYRKLVEVFFKMCSADFRGLWNVCCYLFILFFIICFTKYLSFSDAFMKTKQLLLSSIIIQNWMVANLLITLLYCMIEVYLTLHFIDNGDNLTEVYYKKRMYALSIYLIWILSMCPTN